MYFRLFPDYRLCECFQCSRQFEPFGYGSYEKYCDSCYSGMQVQERISTMNVSCIVIDRVGHSLRAIIRRGPIVACSRSVCLAFLSSNRAWAVYVRTPSITLYGDSVGTMLVNLKPARWYKELYSASVRS